MKWITLSDGHSLNMAQATSVTWGVNEGKRYAEVYGVEGGYTVVDDQEAVEQLEEWMIDNGETLP